MNGFALFFSALGIFAIAQAQTTLTTSAAISTSSETSTYINCTSTYDTCLTGSNADADTCGPDYCSCLGDQGLFGIAPIFCGLTAPSSAYSSLFPTKTIPVPTSLPSLTYASCNTTRLACEDQSYANHASCAAQFCDCLELAGVLAEANGQCGNPTFTSSSVTPIPTTVSTIPAGGEISVISTTVSTIPAGGETSVIPTTVSTVAAGGQTSPSTPATIPVTSNAVTTITPASAYAATSTTPASASVTPYTGGAAIATAGSYALPIIGAAGLLALLV